MNSLLPYSRIQGLEIGVEGGDSAFYFLQINSASRNPSSVLLMYKELFFILFALIDANYMLYL